MTNTIRYINSKTVMLTRNGKTFMLVEIKNPKTVDGIQILKGMTIAKSLKV